MELTATVSYSVNVSVEVPDHATNDQKQVLIVEAADKLVANCDPAKNCELTVIITECSDPDLED